MTTQSYKQSKNWNKGLNIHVAHNNKYLSKTIMHLCIYKRMCMCVCVNIKLVPLKFVNLHTQLVIAIVA